MREPIRDRGRIEHMLEMSLNLQEAKFSHTYDDILNDRILFYGLTKMTEIIGEAAYKITHEFRGFSSGAALERDNWYASSIGARLFHYQP